jgi:hypothetical protein
MIRICALGAIVLAAATGGGCQFVGGLVGGVAESYKRSSTQLIEAKYRGLEGKTFAVVVLADRVIQADNPEVVAKLTLDISARLAEHAGASGFIPGAEILDYQFNHPRWVAMSTGQLGKELGVERIVYVDLTEYRLNDPGNQYIWQGVASAMLGVAEVDGVLPDEFAFHEQIRVRFPDKDGTGPTDMSKPLVVSALVKRLTDRCSWLLYDHQEPYYPDY